MSAEAPKNPLIIVGLPQSSADVHHTTVTDPCDDSHGSMVANPPTTSSPHQLIMVTIIAVISVPNCRPILRPYCLNGKDDDLLRRCPVSVHHFGLDPYAP